MLRKDRKVWSNWNGNWRRHPRWLFKVPCSCIKTLLHNIDKGIGCMKEAFVIQLLQKYLKDVSSLGLRINTNEQTDSRTEAFSPGQERWTKANRCWIWKSYHTIFTALQDRWKLTDTSHNYPICIMTWICVTTHSCSGSVSLWVRSDIGPGSHHINSPEGRHSQEMQIRIHCAPSSMSLPTLSVLLECHWFTGPHLQPRWKITCCQNFK